MLFRQRAQPREQHVKDGYDAPRVERGDVRSESRESLEARYVEVNLLLEVAPEGKEIRRCESRGIRLNHRS